MLSHLSHHALDALLAQFSLYVQKRWPKTPFIHSLSLPLAAGSSMAVSLCFCSPCSLSLSRTEILIITFQLLLRMLSTFLAVIKSYEHLHFSVLGVEISHRHVEKC